MKYIKVTRTHKNGDTHVGVYHILGKVTGTGSSCHVVAEDDRGNFPLFLNPPEGGKIEIKRV